MKPLSVIFFGCSGSGKGTQAELLAKYLELEASETRRALYIETGALLRGFIATSGFTQEKTKHVMNEGGLLPAFLPSYIWTSTLIEQFTGEEHLILDGLARRMSEAPILHEALTFYDRNDYQIISFELSDESARERLQKRHRGDDTLDETAVDRKIEWYKENTQPAMKYLEEQGAVVHRVDAEPSIEVIHKDILERLGLTQA